MEAPCLSTPVGSEDPKTAAVVCVRGALIVLTYLPFYGASHVHQDTFAPLVLYLLPQRNSRPLGVQCLFYSQRQSINSTGTNHYKSNPCPLGCVCPMGSSQPIPCPPGSFGNFTHAEKISDCHTCPAGTFNHLSAQKACFPCGSSSTSLAGLVLRDDSDQFKCFLRN